MIWEILFGVGLGIANIFMFFLCFQFGQIKAWRDYEKMLRKENADLEQVLRDRWQKLKRTRD